MALGKLRLLGVEDLAHLVSSWNVTASAGVVNKAEVVWSFGDPHWGTRVASVAKLLVGMAGLVALEEGTLGLDEPAGPPGATVRHLLAHSSGLAFDSTATLAAPGRRRIYSNTGIEVFADYLAAKAEIPFSVYLSEAVLVPLGMESTRLEGSPAHGVVSTVSDLLRLARELLSPTLISARTLADATRPHFPDLEGVLPGIGNFDPNPWGLSFEIRAHKQPHWTGSSNSPETFGHFGGSGTFLWVDPPAGLACVVLTDREFGDWALRAWPPFSDAVLEHFGDRPGST